MQTYQNVQDDSTNSPVEAVSLVQEGEESIDTLRETRWGRPHYLGKG